MTPQKLTLTPFTEGDEWEGIPAITITSAANWEFTIPAQIVAGLTYGKWTWRIKCKDNTGTGKPKTYLADELTVLETV